MMDPVEVVLVSNFCEEYTGGNKNFSFTNVFPKILDFEDCEVALSSITYTDRYTRPIIETEEEEVEEELKMEAEKIEQVIAAGPTGTETIQEDPKFFNLENHDHHLVVTMYEMSSIVILKKEQVFANFVSVLQDELKNEGFDITLSPELVTNEDGSIGISSILLTLVAPLGYQLMMEEPLNRILGFSDTNFSIGSITSDLVPDMELFERLPLKADMGKITLLKVTQNTVEIDQIEQEYPALSTILNKIVSALDEQNLDVSLRLIKEERSVEYDIRPRRASVKLSPFLRNYMDLPESFELKGEGKIVVPETIMFPEKPVTHIIPLGIKVPTSCSKILVTTNIINDDQFYGGKALPLLALLDREDTNNEFKRFHRQLSPLVYKRLATPKISQIAIRLQSDNLQDISMCDHPTVVTLLFRKRLFAS